MSIEYFLRILHITKIFNKRIFTTVEDRLFILSEDE